MTTDDWLATAASQAHSHLAGQLRKRFTTKAWNEFDQRLDLHFERMFRLLHQLYGWHYDFAWTVESMVKVAAAGYLERPKRPRRADRALLGGAPAWITLKETTWASGSPDEFIADRERQIESLKRLGVTHLHLPTTWRTSRKALETIAQALAEAGIALALDFVSNHTSSNHPWARAAAEGGPEAGFYFFYPDRSMPDRLAATLQNQVPERGGDSFTWHPDVMGGRWVWTTFHDDEWDLNYSNPRVLASVAAELLSLANLGAEVIRLEYTPFLWKRLGTNCESLPEAHLIVQILRVLADIAAPGMVFLLGSGVAASQVAESLNPSECHLGYGTLLMSSLWEALASNDTRLLRIALERQNSTMSGCTLLNPLRDDGDITWVFDDADAQSLGIDPGLHRQYLESFYGPSRTVESMSGLDRALEEMDAVDIDLAIRRILTAWAVLVAASGIPLLFVGDENSGTSELSAISRVRVGMRRLLEVRRGMTGLNATTPVDIIDPGNPAVVAFRRGTSLLAANLTAQSALVERDSFPAGEYLDLIAEEVWDELVMGPYEYRFVRL